MNKYQVQLMAPDEQSGEDVTVDAADETAARTAVLARFSVQSEAELLERVGMNIVSVTAL